MGPEMSALQLAEVGRPVQFLSFGCIPCAHSLLLKTLEVVANKANLISLGAIDGGPHAS